MRFFMLEIWKVKGTARIESIIWLAPSCVMGIEREDGVTVVHTLQGMYHSTVLPEIILRGLEDVTRLNQDVIHFN